MYLKKKIQQLNKELPNVKMSNRRVRSLKPTKTVLLTATKYLSVQTHFTSIINPTH